MKTILQLCLALCISAQVSAQYPLISPAIENAVTLTFPVSVTNSGNVAWNPSANVYYSCRIGSSVFPMITWNAAGVQLDYDSTGQDTRGIWWNPNLNQLERNCFSTVGWSKIDLDANDYAENTFSVLFAGMLQPNSQSVGTYDPINNQVLFYLSGAVSKYNRTTGALVSTLTLTGATFTNKTANGIIYTGVAGKEIGIYDYVLKQVLLFDINTGALSGTSNLPATAPGPTTYGIGYANNLFWVWKTSPESRWYSYRIFDVPLPVHAINLVATQMGNANYINWSVQADEPVKYFELLHSEDGINFNQLAIIDGSSDGSLQYDFMHANPGDGVHYYKVIATDAHDQIFNSDIIALTTNQLSNPLTVYPNPAGNVITVGVNGQTMSYIIYDELGRQVFSGITNADGTVDVTELRPGNYFIYLASMPIRFVKQ